MKSADHALRAIVCGLGSMGKRRTRILRNEFPEIQICGVDRREDRLKETKEKFGIQVEKDLLHACSVFHPDLLFVCTSPLSHSDIVIFALENGLDTFSEINLSSNKYDEILTLSANKGRISFLSSTFLYNIELRWIINQINGKNGFSYVYHIGQYLPDWHPWENFKDFFVADKRTNAIREIMAIEFPWITEAFGPIKKTRPVTTKHSTIDIDYDDTLHLIMVHENGNTGNICFDCVCRKAVRRLEAYSENDYYAWDGAPNSLQVYNSITKKLKQPDLYNTIISDPDYSENIIENPYIEEVRDFIHAVRDRNHIPRYNYKKDQMVLQIIDDIESAKDRC